MPPCPCCNSVRTARIGNVYRCTNRPDRDECARWWIDDEGEATPAWDERGPLNPVFPDARPA